MYLRTFNLVSRDKPLRSSRAVKKGAALCKKARVKKVVKSKGQPRNSCDGIQCRLMAKILIRTI